MVAFLADYLAGDLGSDERSRIEGHLADCAECLAYFRSYRATVWTVRALRADADEPPGHVLDALAQSIGVRRRRSARRGK
jgi:anti-sigma factor RsiW